MSSTTIQWFDYKHLPPHLQNVSKLFFDLAQQLESHTVDSAEKSAGMRKLLEAKDCFVRATIEQRGFVLPKTVEHSE